MLQKIADALNEPINTFIEIETVKQGELLSAMENSELAEYAERPGGLVFHKGTDGKIHISDGSLHEQKQIQEQRDRINNTLDKLNQDGITEAARQVTIIGMVPDFQK